MCTVGHKSRTIVSLLYEIGTQNVLGWVGLGESRLFELRPIILILLIGIPPNRVDIHSRGVWSPIRPNSHSTCTSIWTDYPIGYVWLHKETHHHLYTWPENACLEKLNLPSLPSILIDRCVVSHRTQPTHPPLRFRTKLKRWFGTFRFIWIYIHC